MRRVEDGEIEIAGPEIAVHLAGIIHLHVKGDFRQVGADGGEPAAGQPLGDVMLHADAHRALIGARTFHRPRRLVPLVLQGASMVEEAQARGGGRRAALVAGEKLAVERRLQRLDAMRDGGLRQIQALGGAVETARLHQVEEGFDEFDLHGSKPNTIGVFALITAI